MCGLDSAIRKKYFGDKVISREKAIGWGSWKMAEEGINVNRIIIEMIKNGERKYDWLHMEVN